MTLFGFDISAEDFKEPFSGFPCGSHKILDGLGWHNDEHERPEYDKEIEAILQEVAALLEAKTTS